MNTEIERLLAYQTVDASLLEIELEIEKNDAYTQAAKARNSYNSAIKQLESNENLAKEILSIAARIQTEYNGAREKMLALKKDVEESDADDDVDYIVGVLQKVQDTLVHLEREMEELLKKAPDLLNYNIEVREKRKKSKAVFEVKKEEYEQAVAGKKEQRETLERQLTEMAAGIPSELMAKYRVLRRDKRLPVVQELTKDKAGVYRCSNKYCRMELDAANAEQVRRDGLGECANCRHILYTV